ncbi:DUF4279 domain-containing protein [Dokdonella immobilis]|uniref:DUF4279 domain-containing protein n=1 Tax=Dokdonella immobilis TaxID=578942 RepID=A0A1I5BBI3_9GAMM|nr:DUF4279 domain-containing protein [Dokdonella immobilis]SFN72062.1 protein of unknown function [Dokdonella immobilis]
MGIAEHSVVSFRIFGDGLVPSEVTSILGCEPTHSCAKGDIRVGPKTGNKYVEKTGLWSLAAEDRRPEDIPAQILEILGKFPEDPAVWAILRSRYTMDFFCGVFMGSSNDGLEFSPEVLGALSSRGISLSLDIYDPSED